MRILVCHDCGRDDVRWAKIEGLITGFLQEAHALRVVTGGWLQRRRIMRRFRPELCVAYVSNTDRAPRWAHCLLLDRMPDTGLPARGWMLHDAVHAQANLPPPFGEYAVALEATWRGQARAIVARYGDIG